MISCNIILNTGIPYISHDTCCPDFNQTRRLNRVSQTPQCPLKKKKNLKRQFYTVFWSILSFDSNILMCYPKSYPKIICYIKITGIIFFVFFSYNFFKDKLYLSCPLQQSPTTASDRISFKISAYKTYKHLV